MAGLRLAKRMQRKDLIGLGAVLAALLVVYLPGLGNPLVFDDVFLTTGQLEPYRSPQLQVRMLSYGSFVWVQALFGDGWWKQRIVNLVLHFGVAVALAGLYREILRAIVPAPQAADASKPAAEPYDQSVALWVAIGVFALNPVAAYATAYLIQRSILMATLFVVLGLWLFARGIRLKQAPLHVAAVACYALALASKEHAVLAPLAAVPLYILVARPDLKRTLALTSAGAVLMGAAGYVLLKWYGDILGKPLDETSEAYIAQLAKLNPDAGAHAYPLSVMNQAYLFFQYGLRWFIPVSDWMSIQMRPPFPVTWLTFPHVAGIAGYAALLAGGFFLVARYRDWRALAGISLLFPVLLFPTEFALVWVQDPFVLYRSYIWAIGVPGIAFLFVHGPSPRILTVVGVVLAALLGYQTFDRVLSLSSPERAYTDAIAKLPDDPRAVGRWYPYLNRGNAYLDNDRFDLAIRDFQASSALGDEGLGTFNIGSILLIQGKIADALRMFDAAEKQGYKAANLPFQRAQALLALGKAAEGVSELRRAMSLGPSDADRVGILLHLGRTELQLGRPAQAIAPLEEVLANNPGHAEARYALGMARIASGDSARALETLAPLFKQNAQPGAYYARALAHFGLNHKFEALADIDMAIKMGLDNPNTRRWQAKIRALP